MRWKLSVVAYNSENVPWKLSVDYKINFESYPLIIRAKVSVESWTVTKKYGAFCVEKLFVDDTINKRHKLFLHRKFSQKVMKRFNFKQVEFELNDEIMPKNNKFCCDFGELPIIDMYLSTLTDI